MSQLQWDQFKETVRSRTDLVALFGESRQVTPKRGGREFVCLCPFHDDHSPSLSINPERQSYKCWACGEGGDCFSYLMKIDNLPFREALEILARRAGLEMPQHHATPQDQAGITKNRLLECLHWARDLFHKYLLNSSEAAVARDYLLSRGYDKSVWQRFQIGYHPAEWEWIQHQAHRKYEHELLVEARLISKNERRVGYFDYFVDRVLFPICNTQGNVVAFGGRVIPGREPPNSGKYFNSPESPLFSKSRLLYGLDVAKEPIKQAHSAIVCEGYTDCISLHVQGVTNAVGTLGTALTDHHVLLLKRFTPLVYVVFDGDTAGQNAADRSLSRFITNQLDLRVVTLPEKLDPAEYVQKYGEENFRQQLKHGLDAWSFKLQSLIQKYGTETDFARQQILTEMFELLSQIPDISTTPREDMLLSRLSQRLMIQEVNIRKQLAELRQQKNRKTPSSNFDLSGHESTPPPATIVHNSLSTTTKGSREQQLAMDALEIMLTAPEYALWLAPLMLDTTFHNPMIQGLWQELSHRWQSDGIFPSFENIMIETEDPQLKTAIIHLQETSNLKKIQTRLEKSPNEELPAFVRTVYQELHFCGLEKEHHQQKMLLSQPATTEEPLVDPMIELLRQATLVHQRRTTKKSPA